MQQLFGNDPIHVGIGRVFVACAGTLGNSAQATEGGIPRSSRLEVSLKSLAFVRECPKARGDQAVTGSGDQTTGVTYTRGPEPSLHIILEVL